MTDRANRETPRPTSEEGHGSPARLEWGRPEVPFVPLVIRRALADRPVGRAVAEDLGRSGTIGQLDGIALVPEEWSEASKIWARALAVDWLASSAASSSALEVPSLALPLVDLPVAGGTRIQGLGKIGVHTVADLADVTVGELMSVRAFGVGSLISLLCTIEAWERLPDHPAASDTADPAQGVADQTARLRGIAKAAGEDADAIDWPQLGLRALALNIHLHQDVQIYSAIRAASALGRGLDIDYWAAELEVEGGAGLLAEQSTWGDDPEFSAQVVARFLEDLAASRISDRRALRAVFRHVGAVNGEVETLQDIADEYGVSRERIRPLQSHGAANLARSLSKLTVWRRLSWKILSTIDTKSVGDWLALAQLMWPSAGTDGARFVAQLLTGRLPEAEAWASDVREWNLAERKRAALERRRTAVERQLVDRAVRADAKLLELFSGARWPDQVRDFSPAQLPGPTRGGDEEHVLTVVSAKLGRDVVCDSGLEALFFERCDASPRVARFVEQPFAIPYQFEGRHRSYHPDALLILSDGRAVVVELKPAFEAPLAINQAKWAAALVWCHDRGIGFLATDLGKH